jgi:hypothetical protein
MDYHREPVRLLKVNAAQASGRMATYHLIITLTDTENSNSSSVESERGISTIGSGAKFRE